jgi:GT2 family glycosyltransferase
MIKNELCILIPTINRADLLNEALEVYENCFPNTMIYVLDNGKQNINTKNPNVIKFEGNELGVAESWNYLMFEASTLYDYYLILNDDIILNISEDKIYEIIDNDDKNSFYVCEPKNNWSSFILSKSVFDKVGKFDEGFIRSYYEDNDYCYRMSLANVNYKISPQLNPTTYRNSQTIAKNPELNNSTNNKAYYIKKWGGEPNFEIHKTPFNQ